MGLYDDLLEEKPQKNKTQLPKIQKQPQPQPQPQQTVQPQGGLYDDLLVESEVQPKTFAESHPIFASVPEAAKQFGTRAVKSFPEFGVGVNDLVALIGDKTGNKGLSDFGRSNAQFWQEQSDKIQIDPKYQGIAGLTNKATVLPTIAGSVGDQATNLITAMGGGAGGAGIAAKLGLNGAAKAGLVMAGTSVPNAAQEGQYLEKIEAFQRINGRLPNQQEINTIQNAALAEKSLNTILESAADKFLFGKLFPKGEATKSVKAILKNAGEQAATEAATEGLQEGVSVGTEKMLGINQGDNFRRIADSMAIGGVTGGVMGGVSTAAAQPYDTQFNQQEVQDNAVREVAAKVLDNGRTLYNSAVDTLNQPTDFDVMRQLSQQGNLSNIVAEIKAPETEQAQAQNVKSWDISKLQHITKDKANAINKALSYEGSATEELNKAQNKPKTTLEVLAPNTAEKQRVKNEAKQAKKTEATKRIMQELAPKTTAKNMTVEEYINSEPTQEELENYLGKEYAETKMQEKYHTKDFVKGDIVKDAYTNEVFEIVEPDKKGMGHLRNVDTDEVSTINAHNNSRYIKYTPDDKEFAKIQEFKYDPKAKPGINQDNFIMAQQEYVDAYNEYIKNPTVENREKYQDVYGKLQERYKETEPLLKDTGAVLPAFKNTTVENETNISYNNNKETSDNVIERSNQAGNRRNSGKLSKQLQTSATMVQDQSGLADRINQESDGQNRNARTSSDVNARRSITPEHKAVIEKQYKNQHELNKSIEDFIANEEYRNYNELPEEVKGWLKQYAGAGGLEKQGAKGKGLLSEYYTPKNVVNKMWDLTKQYVNTEGAKVLEPSAGIGRFLENAPENTSFDIVEMNPTSAKIAELLYPNANVEVGEFQQRFIDKTKNLPVKSIEAKYDIVIGNPPYGEYSGRYKGLGEGKTHLRLETYFIERGLDSLKENGIMTFIVPSSFLESKANSSYKQAISKKAELLDAYRLPEKTFDTTSIGTDIIVLRKKTKNLLDRNMSDNTWFENHPEKILGTVEERKNRFGKMEKYVTGDKNAVDSIEILEENKDIQETETVIEKHTSVKKVAAKKTVKTTNKEVKGIVEYTEYKHKNPVADEDLKYFQDTRVDGTLPKSKYSPNEKVNQFNGELYNDFNYMQGNIYEKLDALETENISDKQKEIQRKKLEKVLPTPKTVKEISFNPTSDFIKNYETGEVREEDVWTYENGHYGSKKVFKPFTLAKMYKEYLNTLSSTERDHVSTWQMENFLNGDEIRIDYHYSSYSLSEAEKKKERAAQRGREITKIKNAVEKTFNNFVKSELTDAQKEKLAEEWNRNFNALYTPDYKQMPMLVKGLNSKFYNKDLSLYDVQVEGINFLSNKGVGLLGFEVGVGKTLSGIIATVQNMQMGRCKKPLVLVPNQVKDNWIAEFNQAFPNIKINDAGNMSKFDGNIEEGTITVATYEALGNIWYEETQMPELIDDIYSTGKKGRNANSKRNNESTERGMEKVRERAEKMLGRAEKGNKKLHKFNDLGIDHITVDEAHNFKNLFGEARADGQDGNSYVNISGGAESARAARLFLMIQQILKNNGNRNVFMLTATPFNNQPLEVFNMLSYLSKDKLDKMGLYNVYQFMENYADIVSDWIVDSKNEVIEKQVVTGFKNAKSLRELVKSAMLIRSAEDAGIKRPEKYTNRVILEPSQRQLDLIAEAEDDAINGDKNDVAVLKAITKSRQATLSPDIATDNTEVSAKDFINNSPKIAYVVKACETMAKKDRTTSQIIYMPLGVKFLPKIKEYMESNGVFKKGEVEIISGEVDEEKRNKIVESFNDKDGKVRVIIGTSKIKEGMNLNKNSSVLYVPFIDWNPTDFVQVVGRIWRQGNRYKKIRVEIPLLKNSSDPFMFQKLDEKTKRINNLMDEGKDYIDTSELNTAEEKLNMISNPDKKAKMFTRVEKQKIEAEITALQGRLETAGKYKNSLERSENLIKSTEKQSEEYAAKLKDTTDETQKEIYKNYIKENRKTIKDEKYKLEKLKERIKQLELDFEGKDSDASISSQIEAKRKSIEELSKKEEEKLKEYTAAYEKERAESRTIDDYINEFEEGADELYNYINDDTYSFSSTSIEDDAQKLHKVLKNGAKFSDLVKYDKGFEILKKQFENFEDYTIKVDNGLNGRGVHRGRIKTVVINTSAISGEQELAEVLAHELKHAEQYKKYLAALGVPASKRTETQKQDIIRWENCISANKNFQKLCHREPEITKDYFLLKSKGWSKENIDSYITQKYSEKGAFYKRFKDAYNEYKTDALETEAENSAIKTRKDIEDARQQGYFNGTRFERKRTLGSSYNVSSSWFGFGRRQQLGFRSNGKNTEEWNDGQYSIADEPVGLSSINKASQTRKANISKVRNLEKANPEKVKKLVRDWYSSIEIDRYDVNKKINSLVRLTDNIAKELKGFTGQKVTGKMIREIMPFLRERTDFPQKLDRPELRKLFDNLDNDTKERLTNLADQTSDFIKKYYEQYKNLKGEDFTQDEIENHISHIWDLDKKKKSLLTNYFSTKSRFAMQRTINTLIEGIDGLPMENGEKIYFTPKTLDYAEIVKTQSDSFIKANADIVLADAIKNLKQEDGVPLVLPSTQAPSDWVEFNHPALTKRVFLGKTINAVTLGRNPIKVHPDIANTLKTVFETEDNKNVFVNAYDNINALSKQAQLGFSGFHLVALTESMVGNMGIKKTLKFLNPARIYDEVAKGNWNIYEDETLGHQAIEDGLQFGATLDIDRGRVEKMVDNAADWVSEKIPFIGKAISLPIKTVAVGQRLNNKILWDYLHNNYKLECYKLICIEESKNRQLSDKDRQEIAHWVNDSFGGQVWENLGISKKGRANEQRFFLSPDWLRSTTRQFLGMFSSKNLAQLMSDKAASSNYWKAAKELGERWGINSLTDDVESSSMRGKLARNFWVRSIIYSAVLYNALNALMRMWDKKEHPEYYKNGIDYFIYSNSLPTDSAFDKLLPRVFVGRNSDGTERMLRLGKQFREVPEIIEKPFEKLGDKAAPNLQFASQLTTGHTLSGFQNRDLYEADGKTRKNWVKSSAQLAAKNFVPYSLNDLNNPYKQYSTWSLFAPVSKGISKTKAENSYKEIYENGNNSADIKKVDEIMQRNGFSKSDITKQKNAAKSMFLKPYKDEYVEAIQNKDKNKIKQISKELSNKHISSIDRQKLYQRALQEYFKTK